MYGVVLIKKDRVKLYNYKGNFFCYAQIDHLIFFGPEKKPTVGMCVGVTSYEPCS
jgi:hypothetical protein